VVWLKLVCNNNNNNNNNNRYVFVSPFVCCGFMCWFVYVGLGLIYIYIGREGAGEELQGSINHVTGSVGYSRDCLLSGLLQLLFRSNIQI